MSVQNMSRPKGQQASRTVQVPPALTEYINMCNLLPPPDRLPGGIEGNPRDYWQDDGEIRSLMDQYPAFGKCLGKLDFETDSAQILQRCTDMKTVRQILRTIARWDKKKLIGRKLPLTGQLGELVSIEVAPDGKLEVTHSALLQALDGVEIWRIRECDRKECRRLFWAGRSDKLGCSEGCLKASRNERYRNIGYPESYKPRRIQREQAAEGPEAQMANDQSERAKLKPLKAPDTRLRTPRLPGSAAKRRGKI